MAISTIQSGSPSWDVPVNANFTDLDSRATQNAGAITPQVVSDGLVWLNGAHADNSALKYYQLKDCKRVILTAYWVELPKPAQGDNQGLFIAQVPQSLAPASVKPAAMSNSWAAMLGTDGKLRVWCSDENAAKQEITEGALAINLSYETN
jgi:hypothetical protein